MLREFLLQDEEQSGDEKISGDGYDGLEEIDAEVDSDGSREEEGLEVLADMRLSTPSERGSSPVVAAPLPLINFECDAVSHPPITITGGSLPCIDHMTTEETVGSPLHNALHSRRLSNWFASRDSREETIRKMDGYTLGSEETIRKMDGYTLGSVRKGTDGESDATSPSVVLTDIDVFESSSFEMGCESRASSHGKPFWELETTQSSSLYFDSHFESGNLKRAIRVLGREQIRVPETADCALPQPCDQEYDLMCRKDIYTSGNIQWYYFSATTPPANVVYPIVVRFNIVNMLKRSSLYNYGMCPATYSLSDAGYGKGWNHTGTDVCYYKNRLTYTKRVGGSGKAPVRKKLYNYYTLSYTYTITKPDTVYFAHCYPYTYTRLQNFIVSLERDNRIAKFLRRRLLCHSLARNRCELLTVTEPCDNAEAFSRRPVIVVSARAHPGETNSSYMMEGFIAFLVSTHPSAIALRQYFVFKLIPMLNPDGVIHGNYRCSLAGCDLNRKYRSPDPYLHPTVYAIKDLILSSHIKRGVFLYLDLHGHSRNKNVFSYGCDPTLTDAFRSKESAENEAIPESDSNPKFRAYSGLSPHIFDRKVFSRVLPKILSLGQQLWPSESLTGAFSYQDCSYKVQNSKKGAGRVMCWSDIGIDGSYTIEISFCGNGVNSEGKQIEKLFRSGEISGSETRPALSKYMSAIGGSGVSFFLDDGNLADSESENGDSKTPYNSAHKNASNLFELYKKSRTYTISNLLFLGEELGLAIGAMSNVLPAKNGEACGSVDNIPGINFSGLHELMEQAIQANEALTNLGKSPMEKDRALGKRCLDSSSKSSLVPTLPSISATTDSPSNESILIITGSPPGTPFKNELQSTGGNCYGESRVSPEIPDESTVLPQMNSDSLGRMLEKPCVISRDAIDEGIDAYRAVFMTGCSFPCDKMDQKSGNMKEDSFCSTVEAIHDRWKHNFSLRLPIEAIIRYELLIESSNRSSKLRSSVGAGSQGTCRDSLVSGVLGKEKASSSSPVPVVANLRQNRKHSSRVHKPKSLQTVVYQGNVSDGSESGREGVVESVGIGMIFLFCI